MREPLGQVMSKEAVQSPAGGEQSTIAQELQDAIDGKPMTTDLREWCLERITSLAEYSDLDDPANSSDQELAKAVQGAKPPPLQAEGPL